MVETNLPVFFLASFSAVFFFVLLVIVVIANIRSFLSRVFSIFLLSCFSWSLFAALAATRTTPEAEFFANLFLNVLGLFPAVISYFFFCMIYLGKDYRPWLYYTVPAYFILSYLMLTGALAVVHPEPFPGGAGFHSRQEAGDMLLLAIAWGISLIAVLLFYLFRDLYQKRGDKIHAQKVKLLLIATAIGSLFTTLYNSSPIFWAYPIDIIGQLIAASILTYAILKFELVDVSTKLRNVIVEFIFTGILAAFYLLALILLQTIVNAQFIWWLAIVAAIFTTSLSQSLKERVLNFVDITFYRTRYDYRETITKFAKRVGEILELGSLSASVIKTIKDTFGARQVHLLVFYKGAYTSLTPNENLSFKPSTAFIEFLRNSNQVLSKENMPKDFKQLPEVSQLSPEVLIPLKAGEELVGILSVAPRLSGDFYSREDKNLLYTLSQASAIALKNSLLFQEVVEKNRDIERLLAQEREVNESKDQFIAIASHVLRTPLTNMKGYLYLLINNKLTRQERKDYLLKAFNEQKKLSTLVEDIISISSLERGELRLLRERVLLSEILKRIKTDFEPIAAEKHVSLEIDIKKDITLEADYQKLTQAISNLVTNAIKFTSVGKVTILVDVEDGQAKVCVNDTGIGIEENQISQLFQKFHRATSVRTYNYEGSGLGLYITKLIVDAHGGKISVSSKPGVGSSFCIYLPLKDSVA